MEGVVTWAQLVFAGTIVAGSFALAAWLLARLTAVLVQMERLATRADLTEAKAELYKRFDVQWNLYQEAHGELRDRVSALEEAIKRMNGAY